jgi:hypothetical protein
MEQQYVTNIYDSQLYPQFPQISPPLITLIHVDYVLNDDSTKYCQLFMCVTIDGVWIGEKFIDHL